MTIEKVFAHLVYPNFNDELDVSFTASEVPPRAADGLPCEGVHSPFRRPCADPTSDRHVDASELICSKSKDPRPNLMKLAVVLSRL